MLLTREGRAARDRFQFLEDGDPVPGEGAIIVSGARFLADPARLLLRAEPLGLLWPNHLRVQALSPYLDRVALIALEFPRFKDGRAYSQARQLREQLRFKGELRARGDILRDQFLFLLRAGFDSLDVRKDEDAHAFAAAVARYSVFYQPTADQRPIASRARRQQAVKPELPSDLVAALNLALAEARPEQVLEKAVSEIAGGRLAIVSSFGIESAVLLHLVATLDPALPVLFMDTGWLFSETLAYRNALVAHLGLKDVRTIKPKAEALTARDPGSDLWSRDGQACCRLRKVEPLTEALASFDGWVTGRKRFHGGERTGLAIVERDGLRLKFNPFAGATQKEIAARFRIAQLPSHPLAAAGYLSVGCVPCSSQARDGEGIRDGRWRGRGRSECGIHGLSHR